MLLNILQSQDSNPSSQHEALTGPRCPSRCSKRYRHAHHSQAQASLARTGFLVCRKRVAVIQGCVKRVKYIFL